MIVNWQNIIVFLIVATAVLYGLRGVLRACRSFWRGTGSSCGSCGSCSQSGKAENCGGTELVDLALPEKIVSGAAAERDR